jgi:hypothetical protein
MPQASLTSLVAIQRCITIIFLEASIGVENLRDRRMITGARHRLLC